jgi:Ni,Fe-hydrogenase III large subunit
MIYENLRKYFTEYYNSSNQLEIYDSNSKYELDIYTTYSEDYHNILTFIFGLYIIFSLFYINNIKSSFKRQLSIYYEKLDKIQNEKKNVKKKFQNLILSMKRIKEISLIDDRSAKKVCLIRSEIQKNMS